MAGVQVGDGTHQAPLAERLYQRYGTAFRWVSMIRDSSTSGQTTEELSLIPLASHRSAYWDDADRMAMPEWKHPRIPYWLNRYCIWKVADILLKTFRTSLSRSDWIDYLYTGPYCDLRRRYERWCRYLDGVKPRVIVGNSTFHDVAYIRAWARKQSVPYILLPHGIFPSISGRFHVDGDYLGVFGPLMVKQVRDAGIAEVRRVVSCGPMQFGDKNRSLSRCELPVERRGDGAVLYLGSFSYSFFPASPGAIAREIETLRDACRSQGCRLVVREHPRGGGKGYYRPIVELLEKEHPGVVTISAEPSMAKDIASARLVVASHFDGALIDAFYSNKPVVVFISDDKHNNSPELIGETGCLVRTEEELNLSIQSSGSNDGWVQSRIKRQRDFLSAYMGHRDGVDPWIGAEELIDKALKDTEKRIS